MFYIGGRLALDGRHRHTENDQHVERVSGALGSVGEGGEHLQPFGEVAHRLLVGRALHGPLARPQPVCHGLAAEAGFGIVVCQQLRLCLDGLGKPCL